MIVLSTQLRSKENSFFVLHQVDDFALACKNESTAKEIYDIIGRRLQLPNEPVVLFAYLGLVQDFNGIDITHTRDYIEINCPGYIGRILRTHGWTKTKNM